MRQTRSRTGEVAQRLRALAVLPEVLSSIPRTHMVAHMRSGALFWPSCIHAGRPLCIINTSFKKKGKKETRSRSHVSQAGLNLAMNLRMTLNFGSPGSTDELWNYRFVQPHLAYTMWMKFRVLCVHSTTKLHSHS